MYQLSLARLETFFFSGKTEEEKDITRRFLESYIMAFDTGMAPAVGKQLTISDELREKDRQLIDMLVTRAAAGDCDLTARGWEQKRLRGWLLRNGSFYSDRSDETVLNLEGLLRRYRRHSEPLTFTCVPPGDGLRSALDRDLNGHLDGDELVGESDPADINSGP